MVVRKGLGKNMDSVFSMKNVARCDRQSEGSGAEKFFAAFGSQAGKISAEKRR